MTTDLLDQVIEPITNCLTPESAARIVAIRADAQTQARIDELAARANEGLLTDDERTDYDRLLAWFHMVTILQAQARRFLRNAGGTGGAGGSGNSGVPRGNDGPLGAAIRSRSGKPSL